MFIFVLYNNNNKKSKFMKKLSASIRNNWWILNIKPISMIMFLIIALFLGANGILILLNALFS